MFRTRVENGETLSQSLGIQSARVVCLMLEKFKRTLSGEDRELLERWATGEVVPNKALHQT